MNAGAEIADVGLVSALKSWTLWLGGALAGLSAICYGAGYFLFHAHLTMLGLSDVVDLPHEQMLLEGGRFFFSVFSIALEDALAVGAAVVLVMAIYAAALEIPPLRRAAIAVRSGVAQGYRRLVHDRPTWGHTVTLIVLVVILWAHTQLYFFPLRTVSGIENLLFQAPINADCTAIMRHDAANVGVEVADLIKHGPGCRATLIAQYRSIFEGYLLLLVGVWATFGRAPRPGTVRASVIVRAIVGVYALVMSLLLPIGFGVMVRAPVAPMVEIALKTGPVIDGKLLDQRGDSLLLWSPLTRRANRIPLSSIGTVQVTGQGNLFER